MSHDFPTPPARPTGARRAALAALPLALALPAALAAQDVGYTPEASPYRELVFRQEATVFGGWYAAGEDRVGVAPRSGPIAGLRYEVRIGGPASFYARTGLVRSERTVINPLNPAATRTVGDVSVNLLLADVGLSMNLTGQKSWHGLVPVLAGGLGIASDFEDADVGNYRFGTPFAVSVGAGVRWVPGGNLQLRVDLTDHLYQVKYTASYYSAPKGGGDPVLAPSEKQNAWKHNASLTVGGSYLFFR